MKPRAIFLGLMVAGLIATVITVSVTRTPDNETLAAAETPGSTTTPDEPATLSPSPASASPREQAALANAVSTAVNRVVPGTQIGLAVYDRISGSMLASLNDDQQFYTASVVKLLIATEVLREAGWQVPSGAARDELAVMLSGSSDSVASALWAAYGRTEIDRSAARLMRLSDMSLPSIPGQWEMTRLSPRDVVTVYRYLDERMPQPASDFVLNALSGATRIATDGFDQYFGIPAALPGMNWAVKQGWMEINNGTVLNTTGIVGSDGRYIISLLTRQPAGTGFGPGRAAVTAGIAALAPALNS
ncbi:hypothetical protein ABZ863_30230 [Saccharomonospora sp. NPDC046836]|uniref:hypothetical protein n=1 Tax=Saccharomonospora sp. NPDC046836 TaxID=3156921 RepID=UPI0033FE10CA